MKYLKKKQNKIRSIIMCKRKFLYFYVIIINLIYIINFLKLILLFYFNIIKI